MFKLHIHAQADNWQKFNRRNNDPRFKPFKEKIFKRDKDQCQFCGFHANVHMSVVNLDHNYQNNKTTNMVTACPMCVDTLFLEMCGRLSSGGGTIIFLPEISQTDLIGMTHVAFCAKHTSESYQSLSDGLLSTFKLRAKSVEKVFGKGLSQPHLLGQLMIDTPLQDQQKFFKTIHQNLRFLPDPNRYQKQLDDWRKMEETEDPKE